jgi:hypothetical protein
MQTSNDFTQYIDDYLKQNPIKGAHIYTLCNYTTISHGDESEITVLQYQSNEHAYDADEDKFADLDEGLMNHIKSWVDTTDETEKYKYIKQDIGTSLQDHWRNEAGDYIQCNTSDHALYIILYKSGQY